MKISIKDYAELKKISTQAVYQAVAKNKIETVTENGIKYIIISEKIDTEKEQEKEQEKETKTESAELLNEKIKHLEEMLKKEVEAREKAEKREKEAIERSESDTQNFNKRLEEANHIIAREQKNMNSLLEEKKALEHKTEVIEEQLTREKEKKWYQKLFRK